MYALNSVKVGTKLMGLTVALAIIFLIAAAVNFIVSRNVNDQVSAMYSARLVPIEQLGVARADLNSVRADLYRYAVMKDSEGEQTLAAIATDISKVEDDINAFSKTATLEEEKNELSSFKVSWELYKKDYLVTLDYFKSGNTSQAISTLGSLGELVSSRQMVDQSLSRLIEINQKAADDLNKQVSQSFWQSIIVISGMAIIGALLACVLGIVLTKSITGSLKKAVNMMKELGAGHLHSRLRFKRNDEFGTLAGTMDQFADDLQNIVVGTMKKILGRRSHHGYRRQR